MSQLSGALVHLDAHAKRALVFRQDITQADVTLGCLVGYLQSAPAGSLPAWALSAVSNACSERCEALDAFIEARPAPDEIMPAKSDQSGIGISALASGTL